MNTGLIDTFNILHTFCEARQIETWLVGGAARDLALGLSPYDIDLAVPVDGLALARDLADTLGGSFVALDAERGTGRVVVTLPEHTAPLTIDIVQLRAPTIAEDLRLRDFTINALAVPLPRVATDPLPLPPDVYLDPCDGLPDLAQRLLRPCLPSSLQDDPVRMLRAMRLAAALDLQIAPDLDAALRRDAALIVQPAAERVRDELLRLLDLPTCATWLIYMDEVRLLTRIFPELESSRNCEQPIIHFLPVLGHILETVTCVEWLLAPLVVPSASPRLRLPVAVQTYPNLSRELVQQSALRRHFDERGKHGFRRMALFKLAALLHDNAKPQTKQPKPGGGVTFYGHQTEGAWVAGEIARRLKLSRQAGHYVAGVVREHMRPGQLRDAHDVTARAFVRFFRDTGDAGPDVLIHSLADHMAVRGPLIGPVDWQYHLEWANRLLDSYFRPPAEEVGPLINGNDLMAELNVSSGQQLGEMLRELHEAQAAGEISTRSEALELARKLLARR
ncbi:MAG: HD domain-containing protein [Chloroflexaceae bacterium]|nr:HD domain-containing protein [Chloroflexaceae bacterium]